MPDQPQAAMIEAIGLSKYYGDFAATDDVTFKIHRGEVVAFLGPNGAGKSTTMKLLTGYLSPTAGVAKIAGHDMAQDRLAGSAVLGYLPENGPLYPDMTPRGLLEILRRRPRNAAGAEEGADRGGRRAVCPEERDRQGDRQAFQRLSPARRHGPGAAARAGRPDHGRTDRRPRPEPNPRGPRHDPPARARARRSCSRRTSCKKSRPSPAACCSSTKGGWCSTARPPNCSRTASRSTSISTSCRPRPSMRCTQACQATENTLRQAWKPTSLVTLNHSPLTFAHCHESQRHLRHLSPEFAELFQQSDGLCLHLPVRGALVGVRLLAV